MLTWQGVAKQPMIKVIRHSLEITICTLLVVLTAVVFSQVISRYFLHAPLSWSEELARFLLMWLAMLSAAYAFRTKSHFALRVIVERCPQTLQRGVSIGVHVIVTLFFLVILYQGIIYVYGVSGHIAPALQIPMEIPYSSIIVGSALIVWESAKATVRELMRRETA